METIQPIQPSVEHGREKEREYPTFKLAISGPPHSGKSVFLSSLIENLPDGCNIFRACPDGEGDWSQRTESSLAQELREKEKFSMDFVNQSVKMIDGYRNKILLVDTGGKIDGEDLPLIFARVDGIVVLSREDQIVEWEQLAKKSGKKIVAVIASGLTGENTVSTDAEGVLRGRVTGLERGASVDSAVINKLAEALKSQIAEYCEDEKNADVHFGKLAERLNIPRHRQGGRFDWQPEHLQAAVSLAKETLKDRQGNVRVWGTAPGMVWGAIAAAVRPLKVEQHDPFKGYVAIPELPQSPDGSKNLDWIIKETNSYTFIKYQIKGTNFGDRKLDEVAAPAINSAKGVVVAGKGPWWLTTAIQESYSTAPWIALVQPQVSNKRNGDGVLWHESHSGQTPAVVVYSSVSNTRVGDIVSVGNGESKSHP